MKDNIYSKIYQEIIFENNQNIQNTQVNENILANLAGKRIT